MTDKYTPFEIKVLEMVQELINRQEDTHAIAERSERMARSALAILNRIPFDRGKEHGA